MKRVAGNLLMFQAGWFACVLLGASQRPWLAAGISALIVGWHLYRAPRPAPELMLIATVALLGALFDSLLATSGWLVYASPQPWAALAPVWIVGMWACFATTLNVSLRWLQPYPLAAALCGAAGGPLAYLGGSALGGVDLYARSEALSALAVGWALVMPLVLYIASRLDGWPAATPASRRQALARG